MFHAMFGGVLIYYLIYYDTPKHIIIILSMTKKSKPYSLNFTQTYYCSMIMTIIISKSGVWIIYIYIYHYLMNIIINNIIKVIKVKK